MMQLINKASTIDSVCVIKSLSGKWIEIVKNFDSCINQEWQWSGIQQSLNQSYQIIGSKWVRPFHQAVDDLCSTNKADGIHWEVPAQLRSSLDKIKYSTDNVELT